MINAVSYIRLQLRLISCFEFLLFCFMLHKEKHNNNNLKAAAEIGQSFMRSVGAERCALDEVIG
jgi:hypothetical protein